MFFTSPPPTTDRPPDANAILYSAVIFPGLGQFRQRRWPAACLYLGAGAVATVIFLRFTWICGTAFAQDWLDRGAMDSAGLRERFGPMLKSAGVLLAIYLANVYDVWYAWYRARQAWRARPAGS